MYFLFDYIWYRIARVFYKWDSDGVKASGFVSLSLSVWYMVAVQVISRNMMSESFYLAYKPYEKGALIVVMLAIMISFFLAYRKRYWRCRDRWLNEPKGFPYIMKGIGVIAFLVIPLIVLVLVVNHGPPLPGKR